MSRLVITLLFIFFAQSAKSESSACEKITYFSKDISNSEYDVYNSCQKHLENLVEEDLDKEIRNLFIIYKKGIRENTWMWFFFTQFLCDIGVQDNCTILENSKNKFISIRGKFKQDPTFLIIDPLKPSTYTKEEMRNSLNAIFYECKHIPEYSAMVSKETLDLFRKINKYNNCLPDGDLGLFLYFNNLWDNPVMDISYFINFQHPLRIDFLSRYFSNYISWLYNGHYEYNLLPLKLKQRFPILLDSIVKSRSLQLSISLPSKMSLDRNQVIKNIVEFPEFLYLLKEEEITDWKLIEVFAQKNHEELDRILNGFVLFYLSPERMAFLKKKADSLIQVTTKSGVKYVPSDLMIKCMISNYWSNSQKVGQRIELFPNKVSLKECISIVEIITKSGVSIKQDALQVGCLTKNQMLGQVDNLVIAVDHSKNFYSSTEMTCPLQTNTLISKSRKCVSEVSRYGRWKSTTQELVDNGSNFTSTECKAQSLGRFKDRTCLYPVNRFVTEYPLKKLRTISIDGKKIKEVDHFECINDLHDNVTYSSFEGEKGVIERTLKGIAFLKDDCLYDEKSSRFLNCNISKPNNIVYHLNKIGHEDFVHEFELSGACKGSLFSFVDSNGQILKPILGKQLEMFMAEIKDGNKYFEQRTFFSTDSIQTLSARNCSFKVSRYSRLKSEVAKKLIFHFENYGKINKLIVNPPITHHFLSSKANCKFSHDLFKGRNIDTPFFVDYLGGTFDFQLPSEEDCLALFGKVNEDSLCLNSHLTRYLNTFQTNGHLKFNDKVIENFLCPQSLVPQAFKDSAIESLKSNKQLSCLDHDYSYVCNKLKNKESTLFVNYNHFDQQKIDNVTIYFGSFLDFDSVKKEISFWIKKIPMFKLKDKIFKNIFDEISTSNQLKPIVKVKGHTIVMNWKNIQSQNIPSLDSITIFKSSDEK